MSYDNQTTSPKRTRRTKKRKTILGPGPRIILILAMLALTGVGSWAIITKIAQPFQMRHQEQIQVNSTRASLQATEASNKQLESEYQYIKSPGGTEFTARQQGYVKHGEVSVVIENIPPPVVAVQRPPSFADRIKGAWAKITGH